MNIFYSRIIFITCINLLLCGCIVTPPLPEFKPIQESCSKIKENYLPEPIPENLSLNINEGKITTIDKGGDKFLKNYEILMSNYPNVILPNLISNAQIEIKNDRIVNIDSGGERLIRTYAATRKAVKK